MMATTPQASAQRDYGRAPATGLAGGNAQPASEPLGETLFLPAGAILYHEEDAATHLYKVVGGAVRAFTYTEDGRRQVNGFHFAGDAFGSEQFGHYRSTTEAITDCSLIRYRRHRPSIEPGATLESFILEVALAEIRAAEQQILLLGRMSACSKVAAFFLYLAERLEHDASAGTAIMIPMTRYDIADFLGLSAESVSRCFTKLRQRGMIEMDSTDRITLAKPEALADIPRGF